MSKDTNLRTCVEELLIAEAEERGYRQGFEAAMGLPSLKQVAADAAQVREEHDRTGSLKKEWEKAKAGLLQALVEALRPALEALSSPISSRRQAEGPVIGRGFPIDAYKENTHFYLLSDGRFASLTYVESHDDFCARLTPLSPDEVAQYCKIERVIEQILSLLEAQKGSREKAARSFQRRAEKLRALAVLLHEK